MTVSINSTTIAAPLRDRGEFIIDPFPTRVDNGLGETVTAGLQSAVWRFTSLSPSQWAFFTVTIMAGAPSLTCPAVLWDDQNVETSYSSVTMRYPKAPQGQKNGYRAGVEIVFDAMVPA